MIEDFELAPSEEINLPEAAINDANVMFNRVFEFYGGYGQLTANAKDQIFESMILAQYLHKIEVQKEEIVAKDELLRS